MLSNELIEINFVHPMILMLTVALVSAQSSRNIHATSYTDVLDRFILAINSVEINIGSCRDDAILVIKLVLVYFECLLLLMKTTAEMLSLIICYVRNLFHYL